MGGEWESPRPPPGLCVYAPQELFLGWTLGVEWVVQPQPLPPRGWRGAPSTHAQEVPLYPPPRRGRASRDQVVGSQPWPKFLPGFAPPQKKTTANRSKSYVWCLALQHKALGPPHGPVKINISSPAAVAAARQPLRPGSTGAAPAGDVFGASADDVQPFLAHTLQKADIAILDRPAGLLGGLAPPLPPSSPRMGCGLARP